jgi:hypothetical protein
MGGLCLSEGLVPVSETSSINNEDDWRNHGSKKY